MIYAVMIEPDCRLSPTVAYVLYFTSDFKDLRKKQRRSGGWKNPGNIWLLNMAQTYIE